MADVQIRFTADDQQAQSRLNELQREVQELQKTLGLSGDAAQRAGRQVSQMGGATEQVSRQFREIDNSSEEALGTINRLSNISRRNVLELRERMSDLNAQITENTRLSVGATREERERLALNSRLLRAEQTYLRTQQQRSGVTLANLTQERRELQENISATRRYARANEEATRSSGLFNRSLGELVGNLATIGVHIIGSRLLDFGRGVIETTARVDSLGIAFQALGLDADAAAARVGELQELALLPGLEFNQLTQASIQLAAVGVQGDRATSILTEFGNALALVGDTSSDGLDRAILGLRQIISRSGGLLSETVRISQEELNQIIERVPTAAIALREAFGSVISEDINAFLENAGLGVSDFVDLWVTEMGRAERVPVDSLSNSLLNIRNEASLLQNALGQELLPVITSTVQGILSFTRALRQAVQGDLASLPEPLREVVVGAQRLFSELQRIAEIIVRTTGPSFQALVSSLGSLLGSVFELAGVITSVFLPAGTGMVNILNVWIAAAANLVDTLASLINGINSTIDFLVFWNDEQEKTADVTTDLTERQHLLRGSIEGVSSAAGMAASAIADIGSSGQMAASATGDVSASLDTLQARLLTTNNLLREKQQRYDDLISRGANPAAASMQQLERQIGSLETTAASLSGGVANLRDQIISVNNPVTESGMSFRTAQGSIETFGGALEAIDTRFLRFHERSEALSGAIRELPTELTGVRGAFDVLAPTAARVTEIFTDFNAALVDSQRETMALATVSNTLVQELQDLEGLTHVRAIVAERTDVHNANLVNTAIQDATVSFRHYVDVLSDTEVEYRTLEQTSGDLTDSVRDQVSGFEELRRGVETAEPSLDLLDSTLSELQTTTLETGGGVDALTETFIDLEDIGLRALRALGDGFGELEGNLGGVGEGISNIATLFSNPEAFAVDNVLIPVLEGLAEINRFGQGPSLAESRGQLNQQQQDDFNENRQATFIAGVESDVRSLFGPEFADVVNERLEEFREEAIGTDFEDIPSLIPDLINSLLEETITPLQTTFEDAKAGLRESTAENADEAFNAFLDSTNAYFDAQVEIFNLFRRRGLDVDALQLAPEPGQLIGDVEGTEARRSDILNAGRGLRERRLQTPTPVEDEAIEVEDVPEAEELLQSVFRLTGTQREVLQTLAGDVGTAENAIRLLGEDSTPDEIITAYRALGSAESAYHNQQLAFIDAGVGVFSDDALAQERRQATLRLQDSLFDANQSLLGALEDVGFELTTMFTATSGLLEGTALAVQRIPIEAAEPEPEAEAEEPQELRSVFRFSDVQRQTLGTLANTIETAENAVRLLGEDSTPEDVVSAYQALGTAETDYHSQQLAFIDAGVGIFTDDALVSARRGFAQDLQNTLFDANQSLVGALEDIGFELTTMFTATSGLLEGTALAVQRIPEQIDEVEPEQAEEPAALRESFSFSRTQRDSLNLLAGDITAAENAVRLLGEDSGVGEIQTAYQALGQAETAYYQQQVAFAREGVGIFEDTALLTASQGFAQDLQDSLFDANRSLVGALEDVGFELVAMFEATSGLLEGTALAVQRIPEQTEAAAPEAVEINTSLLQNAVDRARFELAGASSEEDFDQQLRHLTDAIETFYDAETERIEALAVSEAELQDLREDNILAREQALRGVQGTENRFRTERIAGEQRAADEATRITEEALQERLELADREARDRLRAEQDLQDALSEIRDEAFEAEQERADALVELEEETQERLQDVLRDANRSREDIERDFQRDVEDLRRERFDDENEVLRQLDAGDISEDDAREQLEAIQREFSSDALDLGFERLRDLEDVGIREGRRTEDVGIRRDRELGGINQEAEAAVFQQQQEAAALQQQAASLLIQTTTDSAAIDTGIAELQQETAEVARGAGMLQQESAIEQTAAAELTKEAAEELQNAARVQGLTDAARSLRNASDNLSTVTEAFGAAIGIFAMAVNLLVFAGEGLGEAVEAGTLNIIRNDGTGEPMLPEGEPLDATLDMIDGPLDVVVANPQDLYDPEVIAELREQGLNNREIGMLLREEAAMQDPAAMAPPDLDLIEPTITEALTLPQEMQAIPDMVDSISISANFVSVSGGESGGAGGQPVEINATIENMLQFDDGTVQKIGASQNKLRQQGRTL